MKRVNSTDMLMLLVFILWLTGAGFSAMSGIEWTISIVMAIWLILFLIKLVMPRKKVKQ